MSNRSPSDLNSDRTEKSRVGDSSVSPRARPIAAALELFVFPGAGLFCLGERSWAIGYLGAHLAGGFLLVWGALRGLPVLLWWGVAGIVTQRLVAAAHCFLIKGEPMERKKFLLVVVAACALLLLPTNLIREHLVEAFRIPSGSMEPALREGDHIFVDKMKAPRTGDIVVFKGPQNASYAKRVIAVGPATVELSDGRVAVNGSPLAQERRKTRCPLKEPCGVYRERNGGSEYSILLQEPSWSRGEPSKTFVNLGEVYLLGDNRDASHDSRQMGPIARRDVQGVVTMVWWRTGEDER